MHTPSDSPETGEQKPRLLGLNHIALEVDDLEAALAFYGHVLTFNLRGRHEGMAFIDLGDQFIALAERRTQSSDTQRHFGLVIEDHHAVRQRLEALGVQLLPGAGLDFIDLGATGCRSCNTVRSNSPKPRRC